jgi:hypothetical protein
VIAQQSQAPRVEAQEAEPGTLGAWGHDAPTTGEHGSTANAAASSGHGRDVPLRFSEDSKGTCMSPTMKPSCGGRAHHRRWEPVRHHYLGPGHPRLPAARES